jgi:hypothetical protein
MTINNATANNLAPICDSPASMFRRIRVIANGSAVLEDVEDAGRVHQMFSMLQSSSRRYNAISESWGSDSTHVATLSSPGVADPIPGNASRTVVVKLMSAFLNQKRMIPLNMVPLVIELELGGADDAFDGTGNQWRITEPRLIGDVIQIDNALQNSYAEHILSGRTLPFPMHGLYAVRATVPAGSTLFSLPIARGFSRLSSVYFTFWDSTGKYMNRFNSTVRASANSDNTTALDQTTWNITIGSERYPEFDVSSVQESWYRLGLAQLMHQGKEASFSISSVDYRANSFIGAMNLEKALGQASHTGVNTRSGSQLTLSFRNLPTTINTILVVLHYEQVVQVSKAGVEVLD